MNKNDIGLTFNNWTIIGFSDDSTKAKCQCACGTIKDVNLYNVKHGKSKSCGCLKPNRDYSKQCKDLTGQKFGKLTAIEPTDKRDTDGSIIWRCECECGNTEYYVSTNRIKSRKSCGCIGNPSLIGQRFGKLTVIKEARDKNGKKTWECKCDCGNTTYVPTARLRFGTTQSCGCINKEQITNIAKSHIKDLTGQRFGHLVVLKMSDKDDSRINWTCQCDCGKIVDVRSTNLISGNTMSCGCTKISKGELAIEDILKTNNISYIHHFKNNKFKYPDTNYLIEFDFFVDNSYVIEYDGEQHFHAISTWGGEEGFKKLQERDKIRNKLCIQNNIPIIRIPYAVEPKDITLEDLMPKTSKYLLQSEDNIIGQK